MTNTVVSNVGFQGWQYGPAGVLFARTSDVVIDGLRIYNVSRGNEHDGCGIDFEGGNFRTTFKNSEIWTSDGAGICVLDNSGNAGPNKELVIENVDVTRFGRNPYPDEPPASHSEGIVFHLTNFNQGYQTGELRLSRFNNFYGRDFIGVWNQPYPPTTQSSDRFWLNNCCDFSTVISTSGSAASLPAAAPGFPPQNAIDGNLATYWKAGAVVSDWWVDLFADYTVTRVEQKFNDPGHWQFRVQGTVDWQTWVSLADSSGGLMATSFRSGCPDSITG